MSTSSQSQSKELLLMRKVRKAKMAAGPLFKLILAFSFIVRRRTVINTTPTCCIHNLSFVLFRCFVLMQCGPRIAPSLHFVKSLVDGLSITRSGVATCISLAPRGAVLLVYWLLYMSITRRHNPAVGDVTSRYAIFVGEQSCPEKEDWIQYRYIKRYLVYSSLRTVRWKWHSPVHHTHTMSSENLDSDTQVDYEDEKQVGFSLLCWCCWLTSGAC